MGHSVRFKTQGNCVFVCWKLNYCAYDVPAPYSRMYITDGVGISHRKILYRKMSLMSSYSKDTLQHIFN